MPDQIITINTPNGGTLAFPLSSRHKTDLQKGKIETRLTTDISNVINKLSNLITLEDIHISNWGGYYYTSSAISHYNKAFDYFKRQNYHDVERKSPKHRRIQRTRMVGTLITLKYGGTGYFDLNVNLAFRKLVASLLPIEDHLTDAKITRSQFSKVADKVTTAIDALFAAEGIEATEQNRSNLIGLAVNLGANLTKNKKVNALLGTTHGTHNITNPALVHAANKGYTDSLIKLFYIENYFPKDDDEIETLMGLPFNMVKTIIGDR